MISCSYYGKHCTWRTVLIHYGVVDILGEFWAVVIIVVYNDVHSESSC